ncbi:MAG: RDD family protein [Candidatus Sumerlaeia bacterium]|nr:RDD family protein [Candidatus Sumerlaeia bacterium]
MQRPDRWYLFDAGAQTGPHTLSELQSKARAGWLGLDALAIQEGDTDWRPARDVVGLAPPPPPSPAPGEPPARSIYDRPPMAPPAGAGPPPPEAPITMSSVQFFDPREIVGKRVLGYIVDAVIFWFLSCGIGAAMGGVLMAAVSVGNAAGGGQPGLDGFSAVAQILSWIVGAVFWCLRDAVKGRSPGKLVVGLRVVDANTGAPISVGQSIIRNLLFAIPCLPLVMLFVLLATGEHWGDKIAGTRVEPAT